MAPDPRAIATWDGTLEEQQARAALSQLPQMAPTATMPEGITTKGQLLLIAETHMQEEMQKVLLKCWHIMKERSRKYDEAWYDRGALVNIVEMAKKMDRIWNVWWDFDGPPMEERDQDDVVDLVNYSLAFLTQAAQGDFQ